MISWVGFGDNTRTSWNSEYNTNGYGCWCFFFKEFVRWCSSRDTCFLEFRTKEEEEEDEEEEYIMAAQSLTLHSSLSLQKTPNKQTEQSLCSFCFCLQFVVGVVRTGSIPSCCCHLSLSHFVCLLVYCTMQLIVPYLNIKQWLFYLVGKAHGKGQPWVKDLVPKARALGCRPKFWECLVPKCITSHNAQPNVRTHQCM